MHSDELSGLKVKGFVPDNYLIPRVLRGKQQSLHGAVYNGGLAQ